jgi:hypothetical protein
MDLSLDRWKSLSAADREAAAKKLGSSLPSGFTFDSVERSDSLVEAIAFFSFQDARFALIPGGIFELGFDAERHRQPTDEEQECWQDTAKESGFSESIHEYVVSVTFRPRQVDLDPFLIETAAREVAWESIDATDHKIRALLKEYKNGVTVCSGETTTRIQRKADGSVTAERSLKQTHAQLAEQLKKSGFRFPTSDEWEFACGCGQPTLFRWGDHAPCNGYPIDVGTKATVWNLHRQPNAFGLSIASNPYFFELVGEGGTTRGGDGGTRICGGSGFFVGWLPLATAYFEEYFCTHDLAEPVLPGYTVGRRVLDLR